MFSDVDLGIDTLLSSDSGIRLKPKKIGLITNHTGVDRYQIPTYQRLLEKGYRLKALFSPEHGIDGSGYAFEKMKDSKMGSIPVYSLHGKTRRPTKEMLRGLDVLLFDIQDIGVRAYTYCSTLLYAMEEAAKAKIPVYVLDRPNPINGITVDGTMLESKWRSFLGYLNVSYCHGMTIGELATFFNKEYKVGCDLKVIKMKGWKRWMNFSQTGLLWVPTSPHIPEPDTPVYTASTGILGELGIVNIGIGYTLPFKVVGAEWVDADDFAEKLNQQKLPGVHFIPFHYKPFYGSYKGKNCHGVFIQITDREKYQPLSVSWALIGILKSLYPNKVNEKLKKLSTTNKDLFCKAIGNGKLLAMLYNEKYVTWKFINYDKKQRSEFIDLREKYLFKEYD